MAEYYLATSKNTIDLWLDRRLPYEPKGPMLAARVKLRAAIREMHVPQGALLCATYSSLDNTFCDAENVLIYNVGTGAFKEATVGGILFKRIRSEPMCAPNGSRYSHHHQYSFINAPSQPSGKDSFTFAFPLLAINSSTSVHHVWWRATEAAAVPHQPIIGRFAIHIELRVVEAITNVAGVLKKLLDGIISSMHFDAAPSQLAIQRLSAHCKWSQAEIEKRLCSPPNPILGKRRVIYEYQQFVKWDPADHWCEDCTLVVTRADTPLCVVTLTEL
ncbi:MAG: hypothetical protein IPJ12_15090 [Betaproteobacteria bacterium]|nr:hypothetical protein [Betaproteobacteria bacterium]